MLWSMLYRLFYFGKNTHLHGIKYIFDEDRHLIIRICWLLIFILSFVFMLMIFKVQYNSYNEDPISFLTETSYLDWNTTFPAITVCEISRNEYASDYEEERDVDESSSTIDLFIMDILFFTGSCYSCQAPCPPCEKLNFTSIVSKLRKPCQQLLKVCRWNNIDFDCCEQFLPLETEYGTCFSINSLHTLDANRTNSPPNFKMNRKTGPGEIYLQSPEDLRVYFHAVEDVPFINSEPDHQKDIMLGESYNITINIIEIDNDENVKYLPVEKRQCRYPWELPEGLIVHKYYSYSTCVVQCHAENHFKFCNCTHHLMPVYKDNAYCNVDGLKCLTDHFETVNRLHAKGYDKPGLVCDCLPSCIEPEYKIVSDIKGCNWRNSRSIYWSIFTKHL